MRQLISAGIELREVFPTLFITPVSLISKSYTTSNIDADETGTTTATTTIYVYISRRTKKFNFDKEGFVQTGDTIMLTLYDQTVNRGDYVTWNGNTYRILSVLDRDQLGGNTAYKACDLVLL